MHGGVLFVTAFNGDAEVYFRGFSNNVADAMNAVWSHCQNWTNASPYKELDTFIRRYRRPVTAHFNAYPQRTVSLRAALELRTELDLLVRDASRITPHEFKARYDRILHRRAGSAPAGS
jgi:acyl carrier protein phosphodiesterase